MAGMALRLAKRDIESLSKAELKNIQISQQMAHYALFAGGAMLAFGGMIVTSLMRLMEKYGQASGVMAKFNAEMNQAMAKLANSLAKTVGPALLAFAKLLNKLAENPIVGALIGWGAIIMVVVGALGLFVGSVLQLIQFIGLLTGNMALATLGVKMVGLSAQETSGHMFTYVAATNELALATNTATTSTHGLAMAIGAVLGGFMLAVTIVSLVGNVFGKTTAIIVGVTMAVIGLAVAIMALKGVLSFGASVAQDIAVFAGSMAAGGMLMAAYSAATYQKGTSFVRKGGLAVVHGGEEIKSARESTAMSKIEKERQGVAQPNYKRTIWNVPITIENVHTKSDEEDLGEKIRRALKDALDKKV